MPILVSIGGLEIHVYGIIAACAALVGYAVAFYLLHLYDRVTREHYSRLLDRFFIVSIVVGTVCARALYVAYHWDFFYARYDLIPALWNGGWVWQGGIAGACVAIWLMARISRIRFPVIADVLYTALLFSHAIGRLGNWVNQEVYGAPTSAWFGVFIEPSKRLLGYEQFTHFHPTFIYESIGYALLGFVGLLMLKRAIPKHAYGHIESGLIFCGLLAGSSCIRFFVEFLRIDPVPVMWSLRLPQWLALGGLVFAFIYGRVLLLRKGGRSVILPL